MPMTEDALVLVVDDDEHVRHSLGALLRSHGLAVVSFRSGTELLNVASPGQRGCLLLDVRLPDMTGLDVQARLTEKGVRIPTIIMTAYADVALAVRAMKLGAVDFIEKPFTEDALLGSVRAALARGEQEAEQAISAGDMALRVGRLTPREREVMAAMVAGKQNKLIASELGISPRTVEVHRARVMEKMEVGSLSQLVRLVVTARWQQCDDV